MEKRVLIARWLRSATPPPLPIYDEASVSSARQRVRDIGLPLGLSSDVVESVALISSELTHNQLSYARQGYFAVLPVERHGVKGLEVIAADLGPGIGKPVFSASSENRSQRSLGAGLEGVFRLADEVEIDTRSAEGVCVVARKFETPLAPQYEFAIAGRPYPGEAISGDDAVFLQSDSGFVVAISDGLGHGPEARVASNKAIEAVIRHRQTTVDDILAAVSADMAGVRGCAMTVVRFTHDTRSLECVSAGDSRAHLYNMRDAHFFASTPLVIGDKNSSRRKVRSETLTAAPGSVLVLLTDGLESKATLKGQLEILRQPAIAMAQHLIATHSRPNDDALVLVARLRT